MRCAEILVVGMHRSGTSAVTHLLANMGAYSGDAHETLGANAENPKGFWERRDVRAVNDFLLHAAGCEWDALSHWSPDRISDEVEAEAIERIKEIYLKLSESGKSFVIKDPRFCLLLPVWLKVASNPVVVYVHRNPEEVAKSLLSRNGYEIEDGMRLWETYATHALSVVNNVPVIYVDYHSVIENEVKEARRIRDFLNKHQVDGCRDYSDHEIEGTVEPGLRNQYFESDQSNWTKDQWGLAEYLEKKCADDQDQLQFDLVKPSLSDREECLRALSKYSQTKIKYDELQLYKTELKSKLQDARDKNARLVHERELLRHLNRMAYWLSGSRVIDLGMACLRPFRFISPVRKLIDYHAALKKAFNIENNGNK